MRRRFNQGARAEFLDAVQQYAEAGGPAARFVDAVEATVARILEEPNSGRSRPLFRPNKQDAEATTTRSTETPSTFQRLTRPHLCRDLGRFTRVALVNTEHRLSVVQPGFSPDPFLRQTAKVDKKCPSKIEGSSRFLL